MDISKLAGTVLLILGGAYGLYQWGLADGVGAERQRQAAAVADALRSQAEKQAQLNERLSVAVKSAQEATTRYERREREIRRLERDKRERPANLGNCGCGAESADFAALDRLLNQAVCDSQLPSRELPAACDGADLQATHIERASYTNTLIEYIEQEGLRANIFREER